VKMIKQRLREVVNGLGFEVTRRQPPRAAFEIQKVMMGATANPIIFDAGAHLGETSRIYRRLFPDATIQAFEPTRAAVEQLQAIFSGDDRHHVHALALSDCQGAMEFHLNKSGATNSLLGSDAEAASAWRPLVKTERAVKVATQTIDTFCAEQGISRIDILKIDVQGAEGQVLRGAGEMLAREAIKLVYLEVIVAPTYIGQSRPDEIFSPLYSAGLSLVDIFGIWRSGPVLLQFDALFALPEYVKRITESA
jgi:FkbM family methyltransferase